MIYFRIRDSREIQQLKFVTEILILFLKVLVENT